MQFRTGSANDIDLVVKLFDDNVVWLVERGRSAQWGSEPFSGDEKKIDFVRDILESGIVTIVEIHGTVVGASVVTEHPMPYVPAIEEEERYLKLLIASPAHRGQKIGRLLIERAREYTVDQGVDLLRVDCWSGGDGRVVAYYKSAGFTPTEEIEVRPGTSVQVFEWHHSLQPKG